MSPAQPFDDAAKRGLGRKAAQRVLYYVRTIARPDGIRHLAARTLQEASRLLLGDPVSIARAELEELVKNGLLAKGAPVEIALVGRVADDVVLGGASRIFHVVDPSEPTGVRDFNVRASIAPAESRDAILIIYATSGILAVWDNLQEDIDCLLADRRQVVLVLIQPRLRRLPLEGHTYLLSVLLSSLPRRKFDTTLEVYVAPERSSWDRFRQRFLPADSASNGKPATANSSPQCFSALVVYVTSRQAVHLESA